MPKYYIYIPFNEVEDNTDLQLKAMTWRHNVYKSVKSEKRPTMVVHGESKLDGTDRNPTIYVISHGARLPGYIMNEDAQTWNLMSIQELVERMKKDGLSPEMNAKIKLFFCDSLGLAKQLAEEFIKALGPEFVHSKTTVDYYNAILKGPNSSSNISKGAFLFGDSKNSSSLHKVGRASEFRKRICSSEFGGILEAKSAFFNSDSAATSELSSTTQGIDSELEKSSLSSTKSDCS